MGVYHLMGLGLSPGTVIGPLTYLAHRYQRWNNDDQRFFARSGEARQRASNAKVGDVQAIVLFTTSEVLQGKTPADPFVDNRPGYTDVGPEQPSQPMKDALRGLLSREWPAISSGRKEGAIFWCEVDRRDIRTTYERVIHVVAALAGVGGQGKEMWANLTGGNNVINVALQLAAVLSGDIARLYYVQAENQDAKKCVRFTSEDGYWVDLPVMPLALGRVSRAILDLIEQKRSLSDLDLYSHLLQHETYWNLIQGISLEVFRDSYLTPLWKQGLITEEDSKYVVGPQWEFIRPYEDLLRRARDADLTIESLAQNKSWLEKEELRFV